MTDFNPSKFFDLDGFAHKELTDNCENVWDILKSLKDYLNRAPLGNIEIDIPSGVHIVNPELVSIGPGTILEPGCYIKGPCIIGENCTVRHGAYIRGYCLTGNNCVIGHDTEVKHSIFLNGAKAAHFAYVGDSILGNKVNLGAGTKCANLKFDESDVYVKFNGQSINSGLRKFGAIIGDEVQIGCNAVTNPGTIIGKRAKCFPCINVGGVIPNDAIVRPSTKVEIHEPHNITR